MFLLCIFLRFIDILVYQYFLLWNSVQLHGCTTICLFTMNGNLGSFQFLAVTNKASMNIHVQVLCGRMFLNLLGIPKIRFLDHMKRLTFTYYFDKLSNNFPQWLYILTSNV